MPPQLLFAERVLITEDLADADEASRKVALVIHWPDGAPSELHGRKPRSGKRGCCTPEEALAVIYSMAICWSDERIAAPLNRIRGRPAGL